MPELFDGKLLVLYDSEAMKSLPALQKLNNGEPLSSSSLREISVSADKGPTGQRTRPKQPQAEVRLRREVCEYAATARHVHVPLGRLDLVPAVSQIVEASKGLPAPRNGQHPFARQPIQGPDGFDSGGPPDNLPAVDQC